MESFCPPVMAGELRPVPFDFRCYVNLLYWWVEEKNHSFSREWQGDALVSALGLPLQNGGVEVESTPVSLAFDG